LVIGICAYTVNFEPANWGRSAEIGELAEFKLIKTAAAADPGEGLSRHAPGNSRVTVDQHAAAWRVVAATGKSRYRYRDLSLVGWQAPFIGLTIESYAELETGADGRLELVNGRDRMTLAPNSLVALPATVTGVPDITILQNAGQVRYEVESRGGSTGILSKIGGIFLSGSRPAGRFEVHTPLLIAAVKGTTFTVRVDEGDAAVDVRKGSVLVTSSRSGESAYVKAGRRATVNTDSADAVSVETAPANDDETGGTIEQGGDSQGGGSQGGDSQGDNAQGDQQ
jgi:hypothetical protein